MDAAQVDECLDSFSSPEILQESEMDKEARENKEATNTGVPLFIIQKVHRVDGAQDLMEFVEIFGKIREEEGQAEA
jgi:predicted DsbA family dithiol-disulfide isomerase